MERAQERMRLDWTNTTFLVGTFVLALIGTPWYVAVQGAAWPEWLTFAGLWLLVGVSVTAGYHRLFAHKTYQASWPVRLFFLVFGAAALENSVLKWAADHRVHHSHVDHERDPYNIQKGFWWAHIGWIFFQKEAPSPTVVRDLMDDPLVRWQDRWYKWIGLGVAIGVPLAVGLATGRVLGCLVVGCVLRIVASHHATFFINSLCHMVGRQPYSREHSARDSPVMAVLAFGEGYHNYHHSFPFDYRNGIKPWHFDPAKWMIWTLSRLGLASELRRAPDALVLKASAQVQLEGALERLGRLGAERRERYERRLHEAYASLERAISDFISHERRKRSLHVAADATDQIDEMVPEARHGLVHDALERALANWRQALAELRRLQGPVPA